MFEACHPFAFFDYFRVPCDIRPAAHPAGITGAPGNLHQIRVAGHADGAPGHADGPAGHADGPPGHADGPAGHADGAPGHADGAAGRGDGAAGRAGRTPRSLFWPGGDGHAAGAAAGRLGRYRLADFTFFAHVVADATAAAMLRALGGGWRQAEPILAGDGKAVAHVWRDDEGSVYLPFDPGEAMHRFWSEKYRDVERSPLAAAGRRAMIHGYYLARPALPRRVQLRLRREFTRVQERSAFPRWPAEESLHDLYIWLFGLAGELASGPVPWLDLWPGGRSCALVLTHDVETRTGYADMELLRGPERERGFVSSWNFVPLRYQVDDQMVRRLHSEGCEVGVHGLRHDGRDLGSRRLIAKRLPAMRTYARRWDAAGFRSPATQRAWDVMPRLGFEYDSSYSDTDPYEPQPGGCCTYLPYIHDGMVELPITLPQDHTLFSILQSRDARIWLEKVQRVRERGGMVLVLTHPDYARDERLAAGYRELLDVFRGDETVWHALPRDAAAWWRARAASVLRRQGDGWIIEGPAAAAGRVRHTGPGSPAPQPAERRSPS